MSRLSSDELLLLEEVCLSEPDFPRTVYPYGHLRYNENAAVNSTFTFNVGGELNKDAMDGLFDKLLAETALSYGRIMYASTGGLADLDNRTSEFGDVESPKFHSLEILKREKLVEFGRGRGSGAAAEVGWFSITYLGVDFVCACSPRGRELCLARAC